MKNKVIFIVVSVATLAASAAVTVDFSNATAKFRPALHSSGYAPAFQRAHQAEWDARIKEMESCGDRPSRPRRGLVLSITK